MPGYPRTMARMPNRSDLEAAVDAAINLGKAQAKALAALPGAINAVAEAANNINATAHEARAVIRKAQAVTDRLDSMLDHVEPAVSELTPTLQALKEAQQRIVAMTGSTEKMASFVEDAGAGLSRLAGLSGASGLFNRIAAATKPEPAGRPLDTARTEPAAALLPSETPSEEVLAELVGAEDPVVQLDDPEIHDADLEDTAPYVEHPVGQDDDEVPQTDLADGDDTAADAPATYDYFANRSGGADQESGSSSGAESDASELDAGLRPVELGSEADGPDVEDEPAAG